MIAKLVLSIIIITSAGIIGYILAYRHVQRVQQLKNIYLSFQLLETEIMYSSNNLLRAMEKVGQKSSSSIKNLFLDTHTILKDRLGLSLEEAWLKAVEKNFSRTALDEEDKEVLLDFGVNLGSTDRENQVKNFQLIYLQLKRRQENAETLRGKNERMYKSLGIMIGIAIVIVFI